MIDISNKPIPKEETMSDNRNSVHMLKMHLPGQMKKRDRLRAEYEGQMELIEDSLNKIAAVDPDFVDKILGVNQKEEAK